jgi:hypothetical protein
MTRQLTVNTKQGSITFTTELEWDQALSLCSSLKKNSFAQSLVDQFNTGRKPLSQTQINWVYKLAEDEVNKSQSTKVIETPVHKAQVFVHNILASMVKAKSSGLKKPQVRLVGLDKAKIKIVYMAMGTNAGGCWINLSSVFSEGAILGGQITPDGELRIFDRGIFDKQAMIDYFVAINENFELAVKDYGSIMSSCSICGIPLTDPKSIERGIGPICAEKYGMGL